MNIYKLAKANKKGSIDVKPKRNSAFSVLMKYAGGHKCLSYAVDGVNKIVALEYGRVAGSSTPAEPREAGGIYRHI